MKPQDFLARKRLAVAGVSRDNSRHPAANLIYRRLKTTGHDLFAVNPQTQTFEGDRCYPACDGSCNAPADYLSKEVC